ncbi:MAG: TIGR04283 family arsenosugar biosynthesis glycosyltransferase [Planctomycetia bacterium]
MTPTLSIVIPALNEESGLEAVFVALARQNQPAEERIVVDGGSRDDTVGVARRHGATVLLAPNKGRGGQVAVGVAAAAGDVVVVLHADALLPPTALAAVRDWAVRRPRHVGGCLGHRFDRPWWSCRAVEAWDFLRARFSGMAYGDQVQFFRRTWITSTGGYPDQPLMEDVELSLRWKKTGGWTYLNVPATVSARRFERVGYWRMVWRNFWIRRRYARRGPACAWELFHRYYDGDQPSAAQPDAPREPSRP